jgi:hypothetical protein
MVEKEVKGRKNKHQKGRKDTIIFNCQKTERLEENNPIAYVSLSTLYQCLDNNKSKIKLQEQGAHRRKDEEH